MVLAYSSVAFVRAVRGALADVGGREVAVATPLRCQILQKSGCTQKDDCYSPPPLSNGGG